MDLLVVIWVTALVLCGGAVAWMTTLILLRLNSARAQARQAADRQAVQAAFMGILKGRADPTQTLAPYLGRARLMADALLDFLTLVKGVDVDTLVAALRIAGVNETLARRVRRGSLAGRLAAVEALGAFPGPTSVAALTAAAATGPPTLRLAALRSLLQAGGHVTLGRLLGHLARAELTHSGPLADLTRMVVEAEPDAAVRGLADVQISPATRILLLECLGRAGAYGAIPAIIAHGASRDSAIRVAAMAALGALKHPAGSPAIQLGLNDPDQAVRAAAALAAGEAGLSTLSAALGSRLADKVWRVRFLSAGALLKLGDPGIAELERAVMGTDAVAEQTAALILAERVAL